jgi:hypothetical protein
MVTINWSPSARSSLSRTSWGIVTVPRARSVDVVMCGRRRSLTVMQKIILCRLTVGETDGAARVPPG